MTGWKCTFHSVRQPWRLFFKNFDIRIHSLVWRKLWILLLSYLIYLYHEWIFILCLICYFLLKSIILMSNSNFDTLFFIQFMARLNRVCSLVLFSRISEMYIVHRIHFYIEIFNGKGDLIFENFDNQYTIELEQRIYIKIYSH